MKTDRTGRWEGATEVVIMLAVAAMAGAASFSHVHDWTIRYSPTGTGDWFGWANAMVTELIPTAAGLEARRRKRMTGKAGRYPVILIIAAIALSLVGQFAQARPSLFGWTVAAIPALGFLALVKLILSRPTPTNPGHPPDEQEPAAEPSSTPAPVVAEPVPATRVNGHAIGSGVIR